MEERGGGGRKRGTHGKGKKIRKKKKKKKRKQTIIHFAFRLGGISMLLQGTLKRKGQKPPEMPLFLACFMPKRQRIMRLLPEFLIRRKFLMYRSTLSYEERFFFFSVR